MPVLSHQQEQHNQPKNDGDSAAYRPVNPGLLEGRSCANVLGAVGAVRGVFRDAALAERTNPHARPGWSI